MRLAILSDLHYSFHSSGEMLRDVADTLLLRAVYRMNRLIRPDAVVFLGDVLHKDSANRAEEAYPRLREALDKLTMPWFAVPGNHDANLDAFDAAFGVHEQADFCGVRFVFLRDEQLPGDQARRTERESDRLRQARAGYDGPIICFHHVPLQPSARRCSPYGYENADDAVAVVEETKTALVVTGHDHAGCAFFWHGNVGYVTTPSLIDAPFSFLILDLVSDGTPTGLRCDVRREQLAMPPELGLFDWHVHTPLAYCSENMDVATNLRLANAFGLAGIGQAEHSTHLLFGRERYSRHVWLDGARAALPGENRVNKYFAMLVPFREREAFNGFLKTGMEIDADGQGRPVLPSPLPALDYRLGAVHGMSLLHGAAKREDVTDDELKAAFIEVTRELLRHGMHILAHPFRVFRRAKRPIPDDLFGVMVGLLKESGTAAEINFHTNEPPVEFVRMCLESGVKIALGSDAHNLYEVGDFALHLDVLRRAGWRGERDVFFTLP